MTPDKGEMPALDPRAAALLAAYRRGAAMPPEARARVRSRLQDTGPSGQVVSRSDRRRQTWAVVLATAAAVALVWALGAGRRIDAVQGDAAVMSPSQGRAAPTTGQASAAKRSASPTEAVAPGDGGADVAGARVEGAALEAAGIDGASEARPPEPERKPANNGAEGSASRSATRGAPVPPDDGAGVDLREETEVLARGWRAVAAGDVAAARAAIEEHARRFAAGALSPERAALTAICACADGGDGEALARAFLREHPRSPLTRRVREACKLTP